MGPGLVTGAADDDPSGIVSYAQAGAQFGNALLWSVLWRCQCAGALTPAIIGTRSIQVRAA
jgi:Mn2+/Fe2+ NRAMP family transporter